MFLEKGTLILPNSSLKLIASKYLSWLTMHLLCLCGNVYQQTVVFFMGFNCAPDLADFLYSYEADFIQAYLQKKENKLARPLNITIPYEDAVMSLNNCKFCDFFLSHLSHWAWNKGNPRYFKVWLMPWPTPRPIGDCYM